MNKKMDVFDLDLQKSKVEPFDTSANSMYCTSGTSGAGPGPMPGPGPVSADCVHSQMCGPTRGYGRAICDITNI